MTKLRKKKLDKEKLANELFPHHPGDFSSLMFRMSEAFKLGIDKAEEFYVEKNFYSKEDEKIKLN